MKVTALSQSVDVETPELVVFSYTVAGIGSRATAALIDYSICVAAAVLLVVGISLLATKGAVGLTRDITTAWAVAVVGLFQFAVLWLYYVLFEALQDGQTPGKRIMHLRVVRDGGLAVNFEASAIRNIVRIVDMQPLLLYAVGMITLVVNTRGKRLGDMAAGTIVVKEDVLTQPVTTPAPRSEAPATFALATRLTETEYNALDRFVQRRMEFTPERRAALASALASRLQHVLEQLLEPVSELVLQPVLQSVAQPALNDNGVPSRASATSSINALVRLHHEEQSARARGIASRNDKGAARERHAIVAANSPRWTAFAERLKRAQAGGLKSLDEVNVREFVQEYRELTSDLARLRTATRGMNSPELFYLNRLVAGAHSLLYRRESFTFRRTVQFLFADVPGEIRRSFLPIGLAAVLLFLPIAIAARSVVVKPTLAATLLPPGMLARADSGVKNAASGKGYIDDPQVLRPMFASRIITNNVQVTFMAFAFGISAGILTVLVLVTNGVSIGAVIGLYLSRDIGTLLFGFLAPHGVLELTAIVISGGAGFLLAAGMLLPGERTRRAALAANGRRAARLVAGSAFLLLFAGTLEGFVSPNATISVPVKFAISAASALLLVLYLSGASTVHPDA